MVFGSSVNPLDITYKYNNTYPYEAALANESAVRAQGIECSTPASPSRNSDSYTAVVPLDTITITTDRAASPSPSSDSAAAGVAATPPTERPALGRFSASFPQFASHSMSPLDPVTASATYSDGIRGPAAGYTTAATTMSPNCELRGATNSEQLLVTVHPEDLQPPADRSAAAAAGAFELAPAPAAEPPLHMTGYEEGVGAQGLKLPPLPPSAAASPQQYAPSQHGMPAPVARPRHGSATTISYGPAGYPPPSPSVDAAAMPLGMLPPGSLSEHITRTASLPLLMCNAVLPPGASPAIPIAIAGVGASGRARATTVHTPLLGVGGGSGGGGSSVGGGAGGSSAGGAAAAGGHRGVAQSVDHHYIQRHIAAQAAAQQQQQQFFHQSDGGCAAVASSPAQFVGSVSPGGAASFYTAFPGPPSSGATSSCEEVGQAPSPNHHHRHARRPGEGGVLVAAAPVEVAAMAAAGGAAGLTATGRDTDGDEEFEDAVEVQHDDDDHVSFHDHMMLGGRSPAGHPPLPPGGSPHLHHQHQHQHRLQRCNYAVAEPYSPQAAAAAPPPPRPPLGGSASGAAAGGGGGDAQPHHLHHQGLEPQQHSAPLPVTGSGVVIYGRGYEEEEDEEGGDQILEDGSYVRRRIELGGAGRGEEDEDEEGEHGGARAAAIAGGGVADLEEDEDVFDGDEEVYDEEDEELLDDDEDLAYGGAIAVVAAAPPPPPPPQYVTPALEQHMCVNCTRPFWGAACRVCRHLADAEVVVPELLEGAVRSMLAGQAAAQPPQPGAAAAAAAAGGRGGGAGEGVLLAYDDRCRAHLEEVAPGVAPDQGRSHPERPERVAAIMSRLQGSGLLERFLRTTGREATLAELVAVHDEELVSELEARTEEVARLAAQRQAARQAGGNGAAAAGGGAGGGGDSDMGDDWFNPQRSAHVLDCYFNAATAGCARLAAGSAAEVARRVVSGSARHGAAIIRPPGHHAESSVAMGFCYYNNAAVAARAAQAAGARRVVIMDWDVHHGNGTQKIFYDDPSVLYMSTHRYDNGNFYPGTGDASETGSGPGLGFTVNVPWNRPAVRDADMLAAFRHVILPLAAEFRPDLVIVSAGFDAAEGDPLGGCLLSAAAFSHFAAMLSALAPTVLLLEGGYNLTATAAATEACLRVLLGEPPAPLPDPALQGGPALGPMPADDLTTDPWIATGLEGASDAALESVRLALRVQSQYWLAARDHLTAVEAAMADRRHPQLLRLQQQQQQPLQPREQWGWHVQMPAPQAPAAAPPPPPPPQAASAHPGGVLHHPAIQLQRDNNSTMMMGVELQHGGYSAAASPPSAFVPPPCAGGPPVVTTGFLGGAGPELELEVEVVEMSRRRMDVSTSGVMDLGELGMLGGGSDVHMG